MIGVDSVSTGGNLEDASGRHVGHAVGMNSISVTADIYDRHDNYVGKVVGLRSVAGSCSIENRNGDHVGEVSTTHASAVGAALLLLPLVPGQAQKTVAVRRDTGDLIARVRTLARPNPGRNTSLRRDRAGDVAARSSSAWPSSSFQAAQPLERSRCSPVPAPTAAATTSPSARTGSSSPPLKTTASTSGTPRPGT